VSEGTVSEGTVSEGTVSEGTVSGGELLVDLLRQLEVEAAFGVVSVHNLPLVDAIDRHLRWVPTRTEAGAVGAADGYARSGGGFGCAVTSTGTGAGNAAGALIEAMSAATPLLHVTGQIESKYLGQGRGVIHETPRQLEMLAGCSVHAATIGDDPAAAFSTAVVRAMQHPRGPVSLEWPIDRQFATYPAAPLPSVTAASSAVNGDLDRAIDLLRNARRPLVWAGGGALGCGDLLGELLDRTGAALFTSNSGRGALPESDPRVLGNFASSGAGADLLAEADVLLSIGTHFRSNETRSYKLGLPATHVQIDVDPEALGRTYSCNVGLEGETTSVLSAVLAGLAQVDVDPGWASTVAAARAAMRNQLIADIGPYAPICDAINQVLGDDAPRVRDITIPNSSWGNRLLGITDARTNIYPRGGGIGQALGMGIGASIARPDSPTMVLMGDGGLQVQVGELATVAQEQLPITLIVFDDGGYGVLRNMQDAHLDRRSGVDLFTPAMADLASANDMAYSRVEQAAEFLPAFERMVATGAPAMVHVDCSTLGPMPKPFTPPVDIPEPPT
jgi:acetolactate synthase-1/2/3 large subunit